MHGHVTDGRTNPWTTSGGNVNYFRSVMFPAPYYRLNPNFFSKKITFFFRNELQAVRIWVFLGMRRRSNSNESMKRLAHYNASPS